MRILIVGGGIGGLTLANLLRRLPCTPLVAEKQPEWSQAGYALGLWPLGSRVLKGMGLYARYVEASVPWNRYEMLDVGDRPVWSFDVEQLFGEHDPMQMIARAELLRVLTEGVGDVPVRLGTTVTDLADRGNEVEVALSDGTRERFDLVVGCDGVHSQIREVVFGKIPLRSTGWGAWTWWTDPSLVPQDLVAEYWTRGRFFGFYPAQDALCCVAALPLARVPGDFRHVSAGFLRESFTGLGGRVARALETLDEQSTIFYWDLSDLHLSRWHQGRVALLGDAASAFLPTAGFGASAAMESAAVLADELSRADARRIPTALDFYARRRLPRVAHLQRETHRLARWMFLDSRLRKACRNLLLRFASARAMFRKFLKVLDEPI